MTGPKLRAVDASGRTLDDPTDVQVHDLFADLNLHVPFAIVDRLDREPLGQNYFQIHLDYVGGQDSNVDEEPVVDYDVEFREGGSDRHYGARISEPAGFGKLDRVCAVYRAWRDGDPGLWELVTWEPVRFDR